MLFLVSFPHYQQNNALRSKEVCLEGVMGLPPAQSCGLSAHPAPARGIQQALCDMRDPRPLGCNPATVQHPGSAMKHAETFGTRSWT